MKKFNILLLFTMISFFGCSDKPSDDFVQRSGGSYEKIQKGQLSLVYGDITQLNVAAIVNAANQTLLGGGGVDGAIHKAAGPLLQKHCADFPEIDSNVRCNVGDAKITLGFNLPATHVIHTVGPRYQTDPNPAGNLASCYTKSLELAQTNGCRTVAFSCISTNIYGYPKDQAAPIALAAVRAFLAANSASFDEIIFVVYGSDGAENYKIYESLL
jgi:O-acetyl-ADP-ribose deacetylase (regulator of RNase III)